MQCGAKLFRASAELTSILREPFRSRWIFDVEILARIMAKRRGSPQPRMEEAVYELPLQEWHDVRGSKLRPTDFARALSELAVISWIYAPRRIRLVKSAVAPGSGEARTTAVPAPAFRSTEKNRRQRTGSGSSQIALR
jgi:hypothetical protein